MNGLSDVICLFQGCSLQVNKVLAGCCWSSGDVRFACVETQDSGDFRAVENLENQSRNKTAH